MITIYSASAEDIPLLQDIYAKIGQKDLGYFERCLRYQDEGKRAVLLASLEGQVCGYCLLNWRPKYQLYYRLNISEIQDINVIPDARRQGVASALIAHCEDLARAKGHEQIGISFGLTADYGPAQRLYIKLGYVPDGRGVTYDRIPVQHGQSRPVDDDLCLMLVKVL